MMIVMERAMLPKSAADQRLPTNCLPTNPIRRRRVDAADDDAQQKRMMTAVCSLGQPVLAQALADAHSQGKGVDNNYCQAKKAVRLILPTRQATGAAAIDIDRLLLPRRQRRSVLAIHQHIVARTRVKRRLKQNTTPLGAGYNPRRQLAGVALLGSASHRPSIIGFSERHRCDKLNTPCCWLAHSSSSNLNERRCIRLREHVHFAVRPAARQPIPPVPRGGQQLVGAHLSRGRATGVI